MAEASEGGTGNRANVANAWSLSASDQSDLLDQGEVRREILGFSEGGLPSNSCRVCLVKLANRPEPKAKHLNL